MNVSNSPFIVEEKKSFFNINLKDIFILDIGSDSIKVYSKNKDIIAKEASVVITKIHTSNVLAYGNVGKTIYNKLPQNYVCSKPIKNGRIVDAKLTLLLLKYIISQISSRWQLSRATCYLIINDNFSTEDKETLNSILKKLQIGKVIFVNSLDVYLSSQKDKIRQKTYLLLELGDGFSEVKIIKDNHLLSSKELSFTGSFLDFQIINYIAKHFNMYISEFEAKNIKEKYASAEELYEMESFEVYGKDLISSYHKKFSLCTSHVYFAIINALNILSEEIISFLVNQNDEIKDMLQKELTTCYLMGGTSLLQNLDKYLNKKLGFDIKQINEDNPVLFNIINAKNMLNEDKKNFKELSLNVSNL